MNCFNVGNAFNELLVVLVGKLASFQYLFVTVRDSFSGPVYACSVCVRV